MKNTDQLNALFTWATQAQKAGLLSSAQFASAERKLTNSVNALTRSTYAADQALKVLEQAFKKPAPKSRRGVPRLSLVRELRPRKRRQ